MTTGRTPAGSADPAAGALAAAGAVMRPATLDQYARRAGFRGAEILPLQTETWRFYRLTPKVWTSKALESERVLLLTRTSAVEEGTKCTDGLTLFLASLQDPAVTIHPIPARG